MTDIDLIVKYLKNDDGSCTCPICGEDIEVNDLIEKIYENPEIKELVKYLIAKDKKSLIELTD